MKLLSWNVNGLRACMNKGFADFLSKSGADVFCVQETKMQPTQADISFDGYSSYWNSAERKGYSGTAVFTRRRPLGVAYDIGKAEHTGEGRAITLEFERFFLVNVYTPNAQKELARLPYRMEWEDAFRDYLTGLGREKPVVVCGDMNVAREEIDLKNPKQNAGNAGFSNEERRKMRELLAAGFVDTFRMLYPEKTGAYTWWSYMFHAREHNAGWRIDYFLVSRRLSPMVEDSLIYADVMGSDHCPVGLLLREPAENDPPGEAHGSEKDSGSAAKKVDKSRNADIIGTTLSNATTETGARKPFFQRAGGWCETAERSESLIPPEQAPER